MGEIYATTESGILQRQFEVNDGTIRRNAEAVETMVENFHTNRLRIAASLRRIAVKIEGAQTLAAASKMTSSFVGLFGASTAAIGGSLLIMSGGVGAVPILAGSIGVACAVASASSSFGVTLAKRTWVQEIREQIDQERQFYAVVQEKLVEIERLMTENESILHKMSENMEAMGIWDVTTNIVARLVEKLMSMVDLEKMRRLSSALGIPAVLRDVQSLDDNQRKAVGTLTVGIGVVALASNVYSLVDGYCGYYTQTEDVKKICELADLLEQYHYAHNDINA